MSRTVILDFETYYDRDYSLRKMTPVEYILDPRFENILCAVKEGWPSNQQTYVVDGADFDKWLAQAGLDKAIVVSHNALFDMCVLAWRHGVIPRLMVDTLGVSRATLGHKLKNMSLASVARHLNLGVKGDTVHNVIGMNRAAIKAAGLWQSYCNYSMGDAELCAGIYDKQVRSGIFPVRELAIMDMVLRCAIQPKFLLDQNVLAEHLADVKQKKEELIASAMLVSSIGAKSDLMSNDKFAALLREVGCEPPMKFSQVQQKDIYAFAKTDPEFIELEEHPSPAVQVLVAARTGHKSTLEESRCDRFLNIARLPWPNAIPAGSMPIPLRYAGAHTGRLSGEWSLNMQNLPREGKLRRALIARPGHEVLTVDASQIEARIVAWICGQLDLVAQFANNEDVYSLFAAEIFGYPVSKALKKERFVGKTSILGLGFGVGDAKFQTTIEVQSQLQLGFKVEMPIAEAIRVVQLYRTKNSKISGTWKTLQRVGIPALASGGGFTLGPCLFEKEAVLLPNGLRLHYHDLHQTTGEMGPQWGFTFGGKPKKLYGGKLLENIVQALARIITMDAALRIQKRMPLGMQVHDELVYSVPLHSIEVAKHLVLEEMNRRPSWAPDLPLASEVGVGPSYGDAK